MKNKGFTLIELAVVLAIIAVLAAILTPMVVNYLEQARTARAIGDTKTIADAVRLYHRDTGYYPIYPSLVAARAANNTTDLLVGPGSTPTNGHASWNALTATSDLVTILNTNVGHPTGATNPGRASFRGPYIGALESDPWGNRYTITAKNLNTTTDRGFVISAGPNGTLDTNVIQGSSTFAASGDDIATPIN